MESMSSSVGGRSGTWATRKISESAAIALRTRECESDLAQAERVVETPEPVSAQVHGHMSIPDRAELAIDRLGGRGLQRARDLVASELETRDRVVVPDAAD